MKKLKVSDKCRIINPKKNSKSEGLIYKVLYVKKDTYNNTVIDLETINAHNKIRKTVNKNFLYKIL